MSAKDAFHDVVKNALKKAGWTITHDPLYISFGGVQMQIDLGAERLIAAERDGEKIAVEVKSFLNTSAISDFHTALGQFLNYRAAIRAEEPERKLYLAVPLLRSCTILNKARETGFINDKLRVSALQIRNKPGFCRWCKM